MLRMIFIINKISKNNFVTFKVNIELHSRGYFPMWRINFKGFAMGILVSLEKMFWEIQPCSLTLWVLTRSKRNKKVSLIDLILSSTSFCIKLLEMLSHLKQRIKCFRCKVLSSCQYQLWSQFACLLSVTKKGKLI